MDDLKKVWFVDIVWKDHFFRTKKLAISFMVSKADKEKCKNCKNRVFEQCPAK